MRIAFLGTPDFAMPSLKALHDCGHEITVYTQPDRKKGRGKSLTPPPVKVLAEQLGLPVMQFEKISRSEGVESLKAFNPDLMVTAAFGQILSAEVLSIPKHGCINVHASLLPKYRGAAPIQNAIINGDKVTGVTTMMTDIGLDTGDILLMRGLEIGENETTSELTERLSMLGAELIVETVNKLHDGSLVRTPQDNNSATMCKQIKKTDARIDFSKSASEIHNLIRGMNPWPCAYTTLHGETVKIWESRLCPDMKTDEKSGKCIIASSKQGLFVSVGCGEVIEITSIQMPNGKRMRAKDLLNGKKLLDEVFE